MKNILIFLSKKLLQGFIILWLVITLTFFLMHCLPGDPFQSERALDPRIKANLMEKYHLDKPLTTQYIYYLKNVMRGDLGESMTRPKQSVNMMIAKTYPVSADLGFRAILFSLVLGIPLGIVAGLNRGKFWDSFSMVIAVIGVSVPSFVLAGLFQRFSLTVINGFLIDTLGLPLMRLKFSGWDDLSKQILPVLSLGLFTVALVARLMRSKMIEVMGQDYIKLAIAKGLSKRQVVLKHALRNAILPIITVMGPTIALVLTGSFVIEKTFTIPGLGKYYIQSIYDKDYTMVLGITIFFAAFLIVVMILMDILYVLVDPRIKLEKGAEK